MEDPTRSQAAKLEGHTSPQTGKPEISTSPQSLVSKIDAAISTKPQVSKLEFSKSPQPRVTKPEISTNPQSLAAKLEAALDSSKDSRDDTNRLDDSRNEKSEGEADEGATNEKESDDENVKDPEDEDTKEGDRPLIDENDTVRINIKSDDEGEDTPTLPMHKKKENTSMDDIDRPHKEKPSMYLFPMKRLELAWTRSSNMCEFLLRAILIIFTTLGWLFCIGGIPFVSLVMLIIGSIFIDDCKIEPNIPIYLIVAGTLGTFQHFTAIWTKYLPKDSQGRMKAYRNYCVCFDNVLHLFLAIWFVLGCIWIYGVHQEVDYYNTYKDEYCHKTLYLFAFWVLNLSFIILTIIVAISLCLIISLAISS